MQRKSSTDSLKCFKRICLKRLTLPSCSRLYGIEPVGVGTPMIESLTSYVIRIAAAHCVRLGTLVGEEIAPLINKRYLMQTTPGSISSPLTQNAHAMNGVGITATDWVTAMQALTHRPQLRFLTMLDWSDLFAITKLLRDGRAWCPNCYEQWMKEGKPVYDPLMWSLDIVTACPIHKRLLRNKCVHCGKQPPALPRRAQPGFCPTCNQWLGLCPDNVPAEDEMITDDHLKWQAWVVHHLGTMFTALPELPSLPRNEIIADLVSACIHRVARGDLKAFVRRFNSFRYSSIKNWCKGQVRPQLGGLIELCYAAEVPFSDVLIGRSKTTIFFKQEVPIRDRNSHYLTGTDLEKMEVALHLMKEEDPPPSVNEVAARLGCHYITFKYHFPELYHQIKERYSAYRTERFNKEIALSNLLTAKDELPPPSLNSVAGRLGRSPSSLKQHFPEECKFIATRHSEFRKVFANPDEIYIKLQAFQAEFPPVSIIQCAERLGCTRGRLTKYFPEICRAIGIGYSNYRQKKARQRRKRRQKIILETITAVKMERAPITFYQIKKRLPHMKGLTNLEIDVVLQEMKSENL